MMMHRAPRYLPLLLLSALTYASPARAELVDCDKVFATKEEDRIRLNPEDVHQCIMRGASPPASWREKGGKSGGVTVPGSGSSSLGIVYGPAQSPGANGAPMSVSGGAANFAFKFPPWAGFPCQVPGGPNLCNSNGGSGSGGSGGSGGGGTGTGTNSSCPQESDTTGTFGAKQSLSGGGSAQLVCGGAVPLTSYALSITHNATQLAATEQGAYYLWVYKKSGSSFAAVGQPLKLPSYLCKPDGKGAMVQSVALSAPTAQMITYTGSTPYLALRLNELNLQLNPKAVDYVGPERYLVLPLNNGVPQIPGNCALETTYFKPLPGIATDISFENTIAAECEGSNCSAAAATTPAASPCDTATSYPSGDVATNQGTVSCKGKIQITVLNRPNLVYPPGSTPTITPIAGRTGVMANTIDTTSLMLPSGSSAKFSANAPDYVLSGGGKLEMKDGGLLMMRGPATISPSTGRVTLTSGGELLNAQGSLQQSFSEGTQIAPAIAKPMSVRVDRDIALPSGYAIPTQPNPYVRLPVDTQ